jgi:hypothetical protein
METKNLVDLLYKQHLCYKKLYLKEKGSYFYKKTAIYARNVQGMTFLMSKITTLSAQ